MLAAVLERRDVEDMARGGLPESLGLGVLRHLLGVAAHNQDHPAIVELYARLTAEAITPGHPAHGYFTRHCRQVRGYAAASFAALAEAGQLRDGVDPETAAAALIALMDGLQVQWLTDPGEVDLVGPLRLFLQQVLLVPVDQLY